MTGMKWILSKTRYEETEFITKEVMKDSTSQVRNFEITTADILNIDK